MTTDEQGLRRARGLAGTSGTGRVAVIIGGTRPTRITPGIAEWVRSVAQRDGALTYELVDLAEVGLPFLDERRMGALGHYEHEHTRAWSATVNSIDGFVFVFPQYNWGYPAVVKNALDFLYTEWRDKPTSYLTFGTRGGSRAAEQFHVILRGLGMHELDQHIEAVITKDDLDNDWQLRDPDDTLQPYTEQAQEIDVLMAEALRAEAVVAMN
jgi:NAD(P)H-dependent FMN reductase